MNGKVRDNSKTKNYTHKEVFGDLEMHPFSEIESVQYLEISIQNFRDYVQAGKLSAKSVVGESPFFAAADLSRFKQAISSHRKRG